ncbi:serine/threonine-protein kinase [Paraliomyxa miuraensis]|uniref:serine/threonine-protein kinase n=1 Tax=Paraliomyxa miuraensis TaxID=376150 RepID=UPI0022519F79|nr:serine/threonine-protein kinase [Paraliomyxa miuraensis]MCX4246900.1 serine/threonine protein kinase [Paraliomyxa miuraensis]
MTSDDTGRLEGAVLDDRYRIERPLGSGGMGTVYLAQQLTLQMPVAVKVLHRDCTQDLAYHIRFVREARVAARVVHPNVARVLDLGRTPDGRVYSVLEYLRGEDLAELLAREGAMPWTRTAQIMGQTIRGLQAAHAIGVIHRDVKPSNVFLVAPTEGVPEMVKVLDFGIAKSNEPGSSFARDLTQFDKIVGTLEYMAPERVLGEPADARTDVYSLGVMLFEMLTGQHPWAGDTTSSNAVRAVMRRVREPPPSLPEFLPGVPREASELVDRAMARDPEDRFSSLREMSMALDVVTAASSRPPVDAGPSRAGARPASKVSARVETLLWAGQISSPHTAR